MVRRVSTPNTAASTTTRRQETQDNAKSKKTYSTSEGQAKNRAGLEDQLSSLTSKRTDAQGTVDKWSKTAKQGGHAGRNARNRVTKAEGQIKELDPQIKSTQGKLDSHAAPASDAQKFRHNQLVEKFDNAGGGHAGRNTRAKVGKELNASQTKLEQLESKEVAAAKTAKPETAAKTEATAKSAETRDLDSYQKGGYAGRGSQLKSMAKDQKGIAKDKIAKASDDMDKTVNNAVQDGQLRRSEQLEIASKDMEFQAAGKDLKAANQLGKQGEAMKAGAADGKMTTAEQAKIDKHQGKRTQHLEDAKALRGDAKTLRGEAEVARNEELGGDIAALKERREQNLPQIKADYKAALGEYQTAVREAGGHKAVRAMEDGPEKDRITGLKMSKDGAFKAVQASNKSGQMIRSAEEAMADGKVSTSEMAGIDKQVKQINSMYAESDDLKTMGSLVQNASNQSLVAKSIQSGNVKDLFTKPWGKQFMANAMQQQMMMQMGCPMMNPMMQQQMMMNPMMMQNPMMMMQNPMMMQQMGGDCFGRNMFDMQQQMMMGNMFGQGSGMNMFNQMHSPFGPGMDFSRFMY